MTEFDIQKWLIWRVVGNAQMIIPNMHNSYGEMDLFIVQQNSYTSEFEIKISKADFKADKKKAFKHDCYDRMFRFKELIVQDRKIPNKFSYVMPAALGIGLGDIPNYAGLYYCTPEGRVDCQRYPKFIHKNKDIVYWAIKVAKSASSKFLRKAGYWG